MSIKTLLQVIYHSVITRYALGFLLIFWLYRTGFLDFTPLHQISQTNILVNAAMGLSITILSTLRIQILLRNKGVFLGYGECFIFSCIGLFYSLMLPGGISGDAARAVLFSKRFPQRKMVSIGALLIDRFIGLITLLALGIASALMLASLYDEVWPYLVTFGILLIFLAGFLYVLLKHNFKASATNNQSGYRFIIEKMKQSYIKLDLSNYSRSAIIKSVILSVLMNAATIYLIYLCSQLNTAGLSLMEVGAVSPLGLMTNAVPISPGGLGVGEKSFSLLFSALGGQNGAGTFLMTRVFIYFPAALGGLFAIYFLFMKNKSGNLKRIKT